MVASAATAIDNTMSATPPKSACRRQETERCIRPLSHSLAWSSPANGRHGCAQSVWCCAGPDSYAGDHVYALKVTDHLALGLGDVHRGAPVAAARTATPWLL